MPEARSKKTFKALAGALIAAALVVAPLVTAGATAAPKDQEPAEIVGTIGTLVPWSSASNQESYWENLYKSQGAKCYKVDGANSSAHGTVSADGLTVTLNPYGSDWYGDHFAVLVIKAGNLWNNVIENPHPGVAYASPVNNGGNQAQISHWIVCKGKTPETEPTSVSPKLTFTLPTCDAAGSVSRSENVTWTSEDNKDGTTTWIAVPKAGDVFPPGTVNTWVVPKLDKLTEGCGPDQPTQPEPEHSEKTKTAFDCTSATAIITTTTTTTPYVWDAESESWVLGTPVSSDSQSTRPLTQAEIGTCPLVPGDIEAVCVGDVPYLGYGLTLPEGFVADSETPVTITFLNPDGENYVVTDQPLNGKLLWPGASDGQPKMWPGWTLVNGEYAQTDGNFAWTRQGVTVRFDVNPTYSTEVEYPEASAECANPPIGAGEDPTPTVTPTPTATPAVAASGDLAVTGGGVSPVLVAAGGATLAAGIAVVAIAAYRRRRSAAE